ncbi:uncharacterized protein LOC130983329 [Arachis stenosperma]|uniref:uncharacterized protein LOC130983329 n=1 Tax=Arachis stenosperma TaxID=217475 RepID=UPI0025ABAEF2|nr:uncharacterized protein LOC130983329 [Arachis stenosperma]
MEHTLQQFTFFIVTKGVKPGIYASFDEANKQIINYPEPEYQAFNSYILALHAYEARMETLRADREALAEILAETGTVDSPPGTPQTVSTADGCVTTVVCGAPMIRADESASHNFTVKNNVELWLMMYCYNTVIPTSCFFCEEKFHRQQGTLYAFNLVIPGNPFGLDVRAKGRYSFVEEVARDDAAFRMLWVLLQKMGKKIRDFNYLRARDLQRQNTKLQEQVMMLEEKIQKLEWDYENSVYNVTP